MTEPERIEEVIAEMRYNSTARCSDWLDRLTAALERERRDLMPDLIECRETVARLNRRCQLAEAAVIEKTGGHGPSFGRALANAAASVAFSELDSARAAILKVAEEMKEEGDRANSPGYQGMIFANAVIKWAAELRRIAEGK